MKKVLKTMLSDITPKGFKPFFEGILTIAILFAFLTFVSFVLFGIATGIAWLFAIPIDLGMLILCGIIFLGIWINSAYERTR